MTVPASKPNPVLLISSIGAAIDAIAAVGGFTDLFPAKVALIIVTANLGVKAGLAYYLRGIVVPAVASAARKIVSPSGGTVTVAGSETYDLVTGDLIPEGSPVTVNATGEPPLTG